MPALDLLDPQELDEDLIDIIQSSPLPGLDAGPVCPITAQKIKELLERRALHGTKQEAGLWLLAGELDRSHSVSQSIGDRDGSFWHGIMHRREGDFSNAKYWFRQAMRHPIEPLMTSRIAREAERIDSPLAAVPVEDLIQAKSFPCALVDLVQKAGANHVRWRKPLQWICWWEWQLLFDHCRRY
jgi:hypothetical protein